MSHFSPSQTTKAREYDEELILTFLSHYQALEQAILRAGYTRAGCTPATAQADWAGFARHIEARFGADDSPVVQGAVAYMLWDEASLQLRNQQIEQSSPWENPDPHNDIVWLSELVQQTGRALTHALNFPGKPGYDCAIVSAALFIVESWSHLDETVESLINTRHS